MSVSSGVRQIHRWLGVAFTIIVIVYVVVMSTSKNAQGQPEPPPMWLNFFPAGSLLLLEITGLYLFVLPYAAPWRAKG